MAPMDKRSYPVCCTSMYCGWSKCPENCPFAADKKDFDDWAKANNAGKVDEWSNVYVARRP